METKANLIIIPSNIPSSILLCHEDYLQFDKDFGKGYAKEHIQSLHNSTSL
jgi:hypothetical protein